MDLKAPAQQVFHQPTSIDGPPVTVARIPNECDNAIVETELNIAFKMANSAAANFRAENQYVRAFWPNTPASEWGNYTAPDWLEKAKKFFLCVFRALSDKDRGQWGDIDPIRVICVQEETYKGPHKGVDIVRAHTDPNTKTINLCEGWLQQANSVKIPCVNGKHLAN
ncbi:hypothetical protein OEA41_003790 [Lepraria neglecta]|uniref:Uncharacterized protein n=1 Tax=Lepraria neglecta TaxID=209136 RepID=A0AAD9Z5C2_9LECA|nr:hypothetical protein OEA41_003790 [Lepraria neglecta]